MKPLEGKVALVTGASRGIGRAIAEELAAHGAAVAVNYVRSAEAAAEVVRGIESRGGRATAIRADVGVAEEAQRLVETCVAQLGPIDVLVNNAGFAAPRTIRRMTVEQWRSVIETDLSSAFYVTRLVLDGMIERQWGRVVNISSMYGQVGEVGQANYASAKAGLIAFTKTLAREVASYNITANAVCPGWIDTDLMARLTDEQRAAELTRVPLGRFGTAEEVATLVRYLVTEGDWITGQQLNINGGMYM